ncbi:MAG: carboxypeptidase regulatory-like domain-containing protein, partial [Methanobrevibacter olleyae]|nr:carboxypeptidase regulatory-like domain-containing protein [Methanobrevibacter olleyae]
MKFHIKTGLTFLLITIILLVGLTAISAADVDNTQTQEIVKHTEVSTTSYDSVSKDVADETVKSDNLNEKEKTIEKVNNKTKTNTNTITKSPAIQSSNAAVKRTPTDDNPNYIYVSPSGWGPNKDQIAQEQDPYTFMFYGTPYGNIQGSQLGTLQYPTTLNFAQKLVTNTRNVIYLITDNDADEGIIYAERNALWASDQYTSFAPYGNNYQSEGQITWNGAKSYSIIGEEGKHIVWSGLNGQGGTNMLSIEPEFTITVKNIEFKDGNASGQYHPDGNTAVKGGAIDNRGTLTVINCTFTDCEALDYGGAIASYPGGAPAPGHWWDGEYTKFDSSGKVTIQDCTFNNIKTTHSGDDETVYGGAIWGDRSDIDIINCTFNNIEGDYGAVISNKKGTINMDQVTINNAKAYTEGGAIINQEQGTVNIKDSTLTNLQATDYGGAVANLGGTVNLDNVDINHVVITKTAESEYFGGTIYVAEDATITIKNSHLEDMTATHGAVFNVEGGILTVEDTEIENAIATTFGGLACIQDGHVIMDNVKVNNVCTSVDPNDYQKGNGALFLAEMGTIEVSNSNFTNNKGRAGTIGFFFLAEATFENNNFINNEATGKDNYLIESMYSDTTFKNNYFENNTNNYRDMLSVNNTMAGGAYDNPTMVGNTYIDNTLDHTISFMINGERKTFNYTSEIPLIGSNDPIPLINITLNDTDHEKNVTNVELDLRSPYADLEAEGGVKNGTIKILKGEEVLYETEVTNSTAIIELNVNDFDTYNTTVTLKYESDKHFLNKTYVFSVYKITNTTTEVNCDDVPIDNPVTVNGTVIDYENVGANGSVIIRFDDPDNETYFTGTVTEGEYSVVTNPNLVLGEHTVYVEYTGLTDRFNASKNYTTFNVIKRSVILNLNDIENVTVRDDAVITGTVVDEALNTPITTGPVIIKITDKDGNVFEDTVNLEDVVDADGMFTYEYNADLSGHYDVEVQYLGTDDKYEESDVEEKGFNANKIPTTTTLDDFEVITVGDSIVVTGKLTETESGAAIPGAKLNITVPGLDEPIEVTTDADGKFTTNGVAEIKIENTTMNKVTATYAGNDTYVESSDVKDLTVQEAPTNITIDTGDEITAHVPTTATFTLYDVNGNIAPNGINDAGVTVTIVDEYGNNLNTTTVTTGPDGSITVGYTPVTDGEITYTAVYNGKTYVFKDCQNETKRDDVQSIDTEMTVTVDDTVINGTTTVVVDLADVNGNPVNGTIKFVCDDGTVLE